VEKRNVVPDNDVKQAGASDDVEDILKAAGEPRGMTPCTEGTEDEPEQPVSVQHGDTRQ